MSSILLLHSALGRRPGVHALADQLRALGHDVLAPDFYDGQVFQDEAGGIAYRDEVGPSQLLARLAEPLTQVGDDAVLMGMSLGSAFASHLAMRRPRARAVILLHYAAAPSRPWPGQPTQVHRFAHDHWIDPAQVEGLGAAVTASGARFEDWVTPGSGHLFTDPDLPDFSQRATALTLDRIQELLSR
ncbi:dienelactone hydrolase family protein [Gephyromycinifex aptenodytis]|uniref:dienelactone hydrolase family protein n=1 Tax=Gephyromycinifex aptenodytis TaxID=2716227 RepID=UPI00144696AE|nr:dienelactone hydrolase family protein [Gephyromycinifex aptenodytis]